MLEKLIPRLQSWWLLCLSTIITIAIVTASQLFTQRISLLLDHQAGELLAADMLLQAGEPIPNAYLEKAHEFGLQTATTVALRTAIFIDDEPQLIELKAVSEGYPLRGILETKSGLFEPVVQVKRGPRPGELWIGSRIAERVGTSLAVGMKSWPATQILHYEPDRGGSLFNLAPRIMMHLDDLDDTRLLVPGSRAKYHQLFAGERALLDQFQAWLEPQLEKGFQLQTLETARPEMRRALERTRKFFGLSILLTLVIAMIATAITARYAASREAMKVAVMRSFGIAARRLMQYYLAQLGKIWLWALPVGLLLGFLAQFPLYWMLGNWFGPRLPEASWLPMLLAAGVGLIALLGFSLPSLVNVLDAPPMQVLRSTSRRLSWRRGLALGLISLGALYLVVLVMVADLRLAGLLFGLILAVAVVLPVLLKLLLKALQRLSKNRFWLSGYVQSRLLSPHRNALFVMTGFIMTLFSVLLISQVKDSLINDWELQLPVDKPNYFLVNIPTAEVESLNDFLVQRGIPSSNAYALVRSRLLAINNVPVKNMTFANERAYRLIDHVFNMSYGNELPPDNQITAGQWFSQDPAAAGFSVEAGMAQALGLNLNDELLFTVGGQQFSARVTSFRSVVWENFQPNFYVLASPAILQDKPQTWLMSMYLAEDKQNHLKGLMQRFPTVTLLDLSELIQRIMDIIDSAGIALEFFFLFATGSAIIVLLAALNTSNRMRELEIALLQAIGADNRQKRLSQLVEFVLMGLLVGALAALFASLLGWIIGDQLFDLQYRFMPWLWVNSLVIAVVVISLLGMLFIQRAVATSPMRLLRS